MKVTPEKSSVRSSGRRSSIWASISLPQRLGSVVVNLAAEVGGEGTAAGDEGYFGHRFVLLFVGKVAYVVRAEQSPAPTECLYFDRVIMGRGGPGVPAPTWVVKF